MNGIWLDFEKPIIELEKKIEDYNGIILGSFAEHRRNKKELATAVVEKISVDN